MKTIDTGKVEMIAFLPSKGSINIRMTDTKQWVGWDEPVGDDLYEMKMFDLPPGDWKPLGLLSQMTEEKMKLVVLDERVEYTARSGTFRGHFNYEEGEYCSPFKAKDSFNSLCQLHKLWLVNPYGEIKDRYYPCNCESCGWVGSSELSSGGQIADTGDFGSVQCPKCFAEMDEDEEGFQEAQQHVGDYFLLYKDK